jgi:hypothetical protein
MVREKERGKTFDLRDNLQGAGFALLADHRHLKHHLVQNNPW